MYWQISPGYPYWGGGGGELLKAKNRGVDSVIRNVLMGGGGLLKAKNRGVDSVIRNISMINSYKYSNDYLLTGIGWLIQTHLYYMYI